MKLTALILTFALWICFYETSAQAYIPFPDSNCVWSVGVKKFMIKDDSVVNLIAFKKCYQTNDTSLFPGSLNFVGLIRHDASQKKMYGIALDWLNERVLYNFNLDVGDTSTVYSLIPYPNAGPPNFGPYSGPSSLEVLSKDSIFIAGNYRKRLKLASQNPNMPSNYTQNEYWIEGVGSSFGPFQPGICALMDGSDAHSPNCIPALLCLKTETVLTYVNPTFNTCYSHTASLYGCSIPTGMEEMGLSEINVFPNPLNDKLTIATNSLLSLTINIFNSLGEVVYFCENSDLEQELDLNFLLPGLYYLKIQNRSEHMIVKLIKM